MAKKQKWRGIKTNPRKRFEDMPVTTLNRFKQKSMKLPRIDDKKRWAGYPGITGISRLLPKTIPYKDYDVYVEPFAGTAKVFQEMIKNNFSSKGVFILNDKAKFVCRWLRKEFKGRAIIESKDFIDCIKNHDGNKTLFIIDPCWFSGTYNQDYSCFNRKNVKQYEIEVIDICKKIKGDFIITTRKESKAMIRAGFNNYLLQSEYVVCGKYPRVLLTTNLNLVGLQTTNEEEIKALVQIEKQQNILRKEAVKIE